MPAPIACFKASGTATMDAFAQADAGGRNEQQPGDRDGAERRRPRRAARDDTPNAKEKLCPIAGRPRSGSSRLKAISSVAKADATQVAVSTATVVHSGAESTVGWTKMMYAIVMNVVTPASTSVRTLVPSWDRWKTRSSMRREAT
jgi:hypothetical protein